MVMGLGCVAKDRNVSRKMGVSCRKWLPQQQAVMRDEPLPLVNKMNGAGGLV